MPQSTTLRPLTAAELDAALDAEFFYGQFLGMLSVYEADEDLVLRLPEALRELRDDRQWLYGCDSDTADRLGRRFARGHCKGRIVAKAMLAADPGTFVGGIVDGVDIHAEAANVQGVCRRLAERC